MDIKSDTETHFTAAEVAAYLDHTLPKSARVRMQAHLAECGECRNEIVELSRLLRMPAQRRPVLRWAIGAGIAATLALMLGRLAGGPGTTPVQGPEQQLERGLPSVEGPSLSPWGPTADAPVRRDSLVFAWSPAPGSDVQYRMTISHSDGRVLWTASSRDTILRVPPSVLLPGGQTYYWYTDALLPDGRSLTTGVQEFRMAP